MWLGTGLKNGVFKNCKDDICTSRCSLGPWSVDTSKSSTGWCCPDRFRCSWQNTSDFILNITGAFWPKQIGGFHLITSRIYCFNGAILAMHNYGLIMYTYNSNAISLSLSSLCVAGRGLTIPADGKGTEPTTANSAKRAWVWLSSVLAVEFIFNYFLSSNLWSSGCIAPA